MITGHRNQRPVDSCCSPSERREKETERERERKGELVICEGPDEIETERAAIPLSTDDRPSVRPSEDQRLSFLREEKQRVHNDIYKSAEAIGPMTGVGPA